MTTLAHAETPSGTRPPRVPGLPVLGSTLPFLRDPLAVFTDAYRRFGPVYRVRMGRFEWVVLAGPEASAWVARHGRGYLTSEGVWSEVSRITGGSQRSNLANVDGPRHAELKTMFRRTMSREFGEAQLDTATLLASSSLHHLEGDFDPVPMAKRLAYAQLGTLLTGEAPESIYEAANSVLSAIVLGMRFPLMSQLPVPKPVRAAMRGVARNVGIRMGVRRSGVHRDDLVADILDALDRELIEPADLPMVMLAPIIAGLDTMANTWAFVLYRLAQHPEDAAAVRGQLDGLVEPGQPLTVAALRKATYLRHFIMESMRLHTINVGQLRRVSAPVCLGGYDLEEGDRVMLAAAVSHRLGELYPDPTCFDPARFRDGRSSHKKPGAYVPYGIGHHRCTGGRLADFLLQTNTAVLLRAFDIERVDRGPLQISNTEAPRPVHLRLRLTSRVADKAVAA